MATCRNGTRRDQAPRPRASAPPLRPLPPSLYGQARRQRQRNLGFQAGVAGEWINVSRCDELCTPGEPTILLESDGSIIAPWRFLTVHHLYGDKADCRGWNLAAVCQRCHLRVQRTVVMPRVFPWEHTEWFKPYAAGWYAHAYLGDDLSREETLARLDELLALERVA